MATKKINDLDALSTLTKSRNYAIPILDLNDRDEDGDPKLKQVPINLLQSLFKNETNLAKVATSGKYSDLKNLPQLFSGDYNDLNGKPAIPSKTSELQNDSGFLTQHQDISGKADKSELPTKTSDLQNDSGFLTQHQDISGKLDEERAVALIMSASPMGFEFLTGATEGNQIDDIATYGVGDDSWRVFCDDTVDIQHAMSRFRKLMDSPYFPAGQNGSIGNSRTRCDGDNIRMYALIYIDGKLYDIVVENFACCFASKRYMFGSETFCLRVSPRAIEFQILNGSSGHNYQVRILKLDIYYKKCAPVFHSVASIASPTHETVWDGSLPTISNSRDEYSKFYFRFYQNNVLKTMIKIGETLWDVIACNVYTFLDNLDDDTDTDIVLYENNTEIDRVTVHLVKPAAAQS